MDGKNLYKKSKYYTTKGDILKELPKHINHDLMIAEKYRYLCVRRNMFIFQKFLLSVQLVLSNDLLDMLKNDMLNTMKNAYSKDTVEVKFPFEEKILKRDVFIPTMDLIVGVDGKYLLRFVSI